MEYIVKYSGDILSLGYPTDLLGQNYAILELTDQEARQLWRHRQVEYYEPAKRLTPASARYSGRAPWASRARGSWWAWWTPASTWTTRTSARRRAAPGWWTCGT